jgi:hypothetical protein
MRSGRAFIEVPLVSLFKDKYEDEGLYSGEEEDLTKEEHLELAGVAKGKTKEARQEEIEASGTVHPVEVSIIILLVVLATLSNQSNLSY